jgi:glycine/D-amino acid oxidase-like deaminating enzyme
MAHSIAIVGAGIFGLTAAWELRTRGWEVEVIDTGPIPGPTAASTDISKVIRMDYGADELYTRMAEAALVGWDRWNGRWTPPLYHQDGFLVLSPDLMQSGSFERDSFDLLRTRGHDVQRIGAPYVRARFAAWPSRYYPDGYFNPRAGWAESGKVVAHIADEVRAAGVRLTEGTVFHSVIDRHGRATGVRTTDERIIDADAVLIATGAWTPKVLPHLANVMWTTAQPVVHFAVGNPSLWQAPRFPVWAADIGQSGWYGFPALADGTLKIGHHGKGRRVDPDAPRTVLPEEEDLFRQFLRRHFPSLANAPITLTRLCLYCDTFDGDFWIDEDPARPGVFVAAGDSGHGFKFAPVLGPLIADVVERKPNEWRDRFKWRTRVRDGKEAARSTAAYDSGLERQAGSSRKPAQGLSQHEP